MLTLKNILISFFSYRILWNFKKFININFILFRPSKKNIGEYLLLRKTTTPEISPQELKKDILVGFRKCCNDYIESKYLLREYVLKIQGCILEPKYGWGILIESNSLIFDSISNNGWRESYHPSYLQYMIHKKRACYYPEIVSIRMLLGGHRNYWHFYHDLMGQLYLAQTLEIDHFPIVIPKILYEQQYFKQALERSKYLKSISWVIQEHQYIKSDTIYFLQKKLNSCEQFLWVRDIFQLQNNNVKKKLVFLKRNNNRIRYIKNSIEIENIAKSFDFKIVDTDSLSLDMQINLFSEVRYLIGIHGAGLTNIIFNEHGSMNILEIFPNDYIQPHYYWLSKCLGYNYSCMTGSKTHKDTSFYVDPKEFQKNIIKFTSLFQNNQ
jgi:hypothetical protein